MSEPRRIEGIESDFIYLLALTHTDSKLELRPQSKRNLDAGRSAVREAAAKSE
jgi:hypothetical protein